MTKLCGWYEAKAEMLGVSNSDASAALNVEAYTERFLNTYVRISNMRKTSYRASWRGL